MGTGEDALKSAVKHLLRRKRHPLARELIEVGDSFGVDASVALAALRELWGAR